VIARASAISPPPQPFLPLKENPQDFFALRIFCKKEKGHDM